MKGIKISSTSWHGFRCYCVLETKRPANNPSLTVSNEGPARDNHSCPAERRRAGCHFQKAKSLECSSLLGLFNASVHLYKVTHGSLRGFQKQSSHLGNIFFFSRIKCHFFFSFSMVFPLRVVSRPTYSAKSQQDPSPNVHRRRADSSKGPSGPNSQLTLPSSAHILKKHGNQHTLYLQLEQGGSLFCTCLLAFLHTQSFQFALYAKQYNYSC